MRNGHPRVPVFLLSHGDKKLRTLSDGTTTALPLFDDARKAHQFSQQYRTRYQENVRLVAVGHYQAVRELLETTVMACGVQLVLVNPVWGRRFRCHRLADMVVALANTLTTARTPQSLHPPRETAVADTPEGPEKG